MPEPRPSALSPARERLRRLMERYRATEMAPRDDKKSKYEVTMGEARIQPSPPYRDPEQSPPYDDAAPRRFDVTMGDAHMTPEEADRLLGRERRR